MNYELAKQLKDAGWLPENSYDYFGWIEAHQTYEKNNGIPSLPCPTLSELIEACGDSFSSLLNNFDEWHCYGISNLQIFVKGKTPEEAVAKLWLELNKKEETDQDDYEKPDFSGASDERGSASDI